MLIISTFLCRTLTVKSVREQFLKYTGKEKLDAEQKELFKKNVHDIYTDYANKQEGKNKEEGKSFIFFCKKDQPVWV